MPDNFYNLWTKLFLVRYFMLDAFQNPSGETLSPVKKPCKVPFLTGLGVECWSQFKVGCQDERR
jgi:hypothetical protein